jgi:hypothetical protein
MNYRVTLVESGSERKSYQLFLIALRFSLFAFRQTISLIAAIANKGSKRSGE